MKRGGEEGLPRACPFSYSFLALRSHCCFLQSFLLLEPELQHANPNRNSRIRGYEPQQYIAKEDITAPRASLPIYYHAIYMG
jgi:hypothetical protein